MRKALIGKGELLAGLVAGATAVFGTAVILLLLGLIPSEPVRSFFGTWYKHPLSEWVAHAFRSPFWGLATRRDAYPGGKDAPIETYRFLVASFGALLVFVGVLYAVGSVVRRRIERSLRRRAGVLLIAAFTVAVVVGAAAALLAHNVPTVSTATFIISLRGRVTYDPLTYFFGALAATLLVGSFCLGVVGLTQQPWRSALRRAAVLVGICFTVFGLLFPAFVVSDNLPTAKIGVDFGLASQFSAAAGGLAIPLALEAPVSLEQWENNPWENYNAKSDATAAHWRKLALSTAMSHPRGRLYQHAASLGVLGSLVGGAISAAVLGALVLVSIGLCRSAGASGPRRGLSLGILQGSAIACLLAVVAWLSSYQLSLNGSATYWGPTALGSAQTIVTLILVCGLSGLVYGATQARRESRATPVT